MISKVIQLHQENMGLRAFVAENITQTKILRDELNRLNSALSAYQLQHPAVHRLSMDTSLSIPHPPAPPSSNNQERPKKSSLFDIISEDNSSLFNH